MKRKVIEIWLEEHEDNEDEDVEFVNVIKQDDPLFDKASGILKEFAYIFFKINEQNVDRTEVNTVDRKRTDSEQ